MAQTKITEKTPEIHVKSTTEQRRVRDNELVRGRFTFTEVPGGTLRFAFKKYQGDHIKDYTINDGAIVTIPRGVAKHLATNGKYPVHENAMDENGRPFMRIKSYNTRYNFESLEFFDEEDLGSGSKLFTVERV